MPFPEKVRRYHQRSQGNRCQTMVYSEKHGFRRCGRTGRLEDDHIDPEANMLAEGRDPNNEADGIIRCVQHHRGTGKRQDGSYAGWGEAEWSKHPDMGEALERFHQGDKDAFAKAGELHRKRAQRGIRYWNTDQATDEYEREEVKELEWKHFLKTGESRPKVPKHKDAPPKKKHWYDFLL